MKTSALAGEVRKRLERITALLSNSAPPDLVLNRHCGACEFRHRCREIAVERRLAARRFLSAFIEMDLLVCAQTRVPAAS